MGHEYDPMTDEESVAFLYYWLNAIVFCLRSVQMQKLFLPLASLLHEGYKFNLAKLILGHLFDKLGHLVDCLRANSSTFKLQFKVKMKLKRGNGRRQPWREGQPWRSNTFNLQFKVKLEVKRGNGRKHPGGRTRLTSSLRVALEVSNTFKLQFEVKLELKRGNGESNPGGENLSNTFKLQFEVKLELKRGNGSLVLFPLLAFNLQFKFKVKLEVKRGHASLVRLSILAFNLQFKFKLKLQLKRQILPVRPFVEARLSFSLRVALEVSNTFKLQFEVKLELKRGNGESNPGGENLSNTFKLQFEVKLELKRGNGSLVLFPLLAFNLQFKVKLEVKRGTLC
ncbi:hypothetical protein Ahy_B10g103026 [Arachis hypogaea]|uniref:Aminotransferase-like plant mobile domain-containing protein n=1 Tax=Arachis hypogaea TaxID=3818 RepID=A0A444X3E7_ARAHY|nr:hypothetical protein Ahy_B10g103026 [Arachis hypogaea]